MRVVVTGANGFVGRDLVSVFAAQPGLTVIAAARRPDADQHQMPDLTTSSHTSFATLLSGADTVVHLAAVTPGKDAPSSQFETVNVTGVKRLAEAALQHGVTRFILVSTVRVSGAVTKETPITEASPVTLDDAYAASKAAAEAALIEQTSNSKMSWTIVRPPLVYGPGVRGPMHRLATAVVTGKPLPFGSITHNRRDMIGVRNLSEFLMRAASHPAAANQIFVVRDGEALSTRGLIETIATAAQKPARLMRVSTQLLSAAGRIGGPGSSLARLIGDYRIDDSKARTMLGWHAPHPVSFDIARMVEALVER